MRMLKRALAALAAVALVSGALTGAAVPAYAVTQCSDGVDNDGDGHTDFPGDPGCGSADDTTEGASCPPLAGLVVACLDPGSLFAEYAVDDVSTSGGAAHEIAGYVDQYRFVVAGVTVTLSCVQLVADGTDVNPCDAAGGTFVTRVTSLVQQPTEPVVETERLVSVEVCRAELTFTAAGNGIDSAPAYALC